jgi:hypothetical protein
MYQNMIAEILARHGRTGYDPRHIEAFMRLEHGTLDAMSHEQFEREVEASRICVKSVSYEASEHLAKSFGI